MKNPFHLFFPSASPNVKPRNRAHSNKWRSFLFLIFLSCSISLGGVMSIVRAQTDPPAAIETFPKNSVEPSPSSIPEESAPSDGSFALPNPLPPTPIVAVPANGKYVLELNRSPLVGNRLRLESIYDEARLRFTRPRNWKPKTVKMSLRYRHSPALYASRSNLTVLINGTSIGSVPLNQPETKIGTAVFDVSPALIQDYNEITIAALQNNSPTCTQDPYDPSLWTEVLPDSKLVFDFQPQPIALDFSSYPYPIFDTLSLEANQVAYLQPQTVDETWLTAASRFQAALGRVAVYRDMKTRLISDINQAKPNQPLIVIGTPESQPLLKSLKLPLSIENEQILDGNQQPFPRDVGLLMLTTADENRTPVLVATGNGEIGVEKAVQFLVQTPDRQMGTGNVIVVSEVASVPSPPLRQWSGYLPVQDRFQLSDLQTYDRQPYKDVSVRGSHAPALEVDFRALPDDVFVPGSSMTLNYSYGAQVNPLTSLVEVQIDGVPLAGNRLSSADGAVRQSMKIEITPDRIKPNSKMQINFRLDPRERRSCSRVTDQQLWGTIHADTSFDLKREHSSRMPDLKLVQSAFPFAAPQDLSSTAIVLPRKPSPQDVALLLEVSARLGRLSRSDALQLDTYRADKLPPEKRKISHLIGIGTQAEFPFPEAFEADGFALKNLLSRQRGQSAVQTLPDREGVLKEIVSPWNSDRVLLALTGQTDAGLAQVGHLISQDPLFYQLDGDTVLISANQSERNQSKRSPDAQQDFNLEFLRQSSQREVSTTNQFERLLIMLRNNWFILAPGLIAAALMLYGVAQLFLKKFTGQEQGNG